MGFPDDEKKLAERQWGKAGGDAEPVSGKVFEIYQEGVMVKTKHGKAVSVARIDLTKADKKYISQLYKKGVIKEIVTWHGGSMDDMIRKGFSKHPKTSRSPFDDDQSTRP